ncbi:ATP-binding protein [Streptomyces sp. NRRL F-5727]|uniref:ATP-binding protein n=1 Tax=Streptomyces sp. NRRL F-5727 TaxID=1463871 RepID=UPI0004CBB2FB|nr:ATP-binding protein [Streptomyces sp. NRRL F-5727]
MTEEIPTLQLTPTTDQFDIQLSPTPRGVRLARLLAVEWLRPRRGLPYAVTEAAAQIIAELTTNAATHGRVAGRDFRLALCAHPGLLRIEVSDTRGDDLPEPRAGRGLLLVEALADRWGTTPGPVPRKTVWAELDL